MVQLHADNPEHEAVLRKTGVPRTDPTAGVLTPAEAEARTSRGLRSSGTLVELDLSTPKAVVLVDGDY